MVTTVVVVVVVEVGLDCRTTTRTPAVGSVVGGDDGEVGGVTVRPGPGSVVVVVVVVGAGVGGANLW